MRQRIVHRHYGIDLLRGICILYIVGFWHMLEYAGTGPEHTNLVTFRITWTVLGTFVFLSGYFIGGKSLSLDRKGIADFYLTRVMRIYPLYLLAIVVFTSIGLSGPKTSLKAALMLSMVMKPAPPTLWFITMLMLFTIASPLLLAACRRFSLPQIALGYVLLAALLLLYGHVTGRLDYRIVTYLPAFVWGMWIAEKEPTAAPKPSLVCAALILGVLVSVLTDTPNREANWLGATLMVTAAPLPIMRLFQRIEIRFKGVAWGVLAVGYASYGMYLFHRPVYAVLKKVYFPDAYAAQLLYLAVGLGGTILLAYGIQQVYDTVHHALTAALSARGRARRPAGPSAR